MASCRKRGKNGSLFVPKKPHFIRVILSDTMKNQKIAIPRSFLSVHGKSLSKSALLKVPSGETWKVELLKHKDGVSFEKGWGKFIAYYSVNYGDFLFFEYEGNSMFNVVIIDNSFTEVDYPCNRTDVAESTQEENFEDPEDDDDDDDDVEFLGELSADSQQTRKGTKGKEKLGCSRNSEVHKPGNPRFTVQIIDKHLPPRSNLNIPAWFAKKYLEESKGNITLNVLGAGSWSVMYRTYGTGKGARTRIQGWNDFTRDNYLAVDNICSFDLLKVESHNVTFQVTISRPNQH